MYTVVLFTCIFSHSLLTMSSSCCLDAIKKLFLSPGRMGRMGGLSRRPPSGISCNQSISDTNRFCWRVNDKKATDNYNYRKKQCYMY